MSKKMYKVFDAILDDAAKEYLLVNSDYEGVYNYAWNGMRISLSEEEITFLVQKLARHADLDELCLLDANTYWHEFENPILEFGEN